MLTLTRPGIEEYAESKTQPTNELLAELHKETHEEMDYPQMLTGPIEGSFLRLMVQTSGAKSILEIGMFTGYSALSMAEGLPADGKLTTLEINPKCIQFAKKYFERSEHGKKITVKEGPALNSLEALEGPFDFVFIDADKGNYQNYYEAVLPKLKSGGIILIDNVLWSGAVLDPKTEDDKAIDDLNKHVAQDKRVDKVLLTIRDGVFFIRKK
ncbi:class I SAM-dependent methyltransferase [soil metagenome]